MKHEPIGNTAAICPHCEQNLAKTPGRKAKCPHCQHFMYVRTRPCDGQRVLVTLEQAEQIDGQWSIENGTHGMYLAKKSRVSEERIRLANRLGREPSDNEVSWSILNQDMMEHATQHDWRSFRVAKLGMADILRKESQLDQALIAYLELCYIDINGPCDRCTIPEDIRKYVLPEYLPWDPNNIGILAPGILGRISKLIKTTGTSRSDVQAVFFERATKVNEALNLPVAVDIAWGKLHKALF